jgi:hypothetical protein
MAYSHPRVLCVGSYPAVFESRNRILELAGFEVVPSFRGLDAVTKFASRSFDCVVIGDSSELLRRKLIRDLRRINPSVPIVVVYPLAESISGNELADVAVDSLEGPETLLQTVSSVIRKVPRFAVVRRASATVAG